MKHYTMAKQSWHLALLEYLSTPLDNNAPSPSELNGCQFISLLPNVSKSNIKHSDQLVDRHDAQLQQDNRDHVLPELPVGSIVGYRDHVTNKFSVGVVSVVMPILSMHLPTLLGLLMLSVLVRQISLKRG